MHCAASVSFDDTYENSFRANVLGCRNALEFSKGLQAAPGSPFVAHVAIETSYIHGRRKRSIAQEDALVFPRHFYNNYYELTKAMASIETDRALVEDGLRVTQLLPSIVIGHSRTGNNRGDTKVLNAPINAFGRAKEALDSLGGEWADRARAWLVGRVATTFPADRSAEINLVARGPGGRPASSPRSGTPEAIGARIHLATDNRIRSEEICRITEEELEVSVRMADPTLTRNLTLPLVKALLLALGEPKLANVLERLGTIFGVYGEWGQPIHDVGNDVRLLGLPIRRPDTLATFRMLCRHNKYVQEFGQVRDLDEVARRERLWENAIDEIEYETGRQVASMRPREFRRLLVGEDRPARVPRALTGRRSDRCRRRGAGVCCSRGRSAPGEPPSGRKEPTHDGRPRSPGPDPDPGRGGPHPGLRRADVEPALREGDGRCDAREGEARGGEWDGPQADERADPLGAQAGALPNRVPRARGGRPQGEGEGPPAAPRKPAARKREGEAGRRPSRLPCPGSRSPGPRPTSGRGSCGASSRRAAPTRWWRWTSRRRPRRCTGCGTGWWT